LFKNPLDAKGRPVGLSAVGFTPDGKQIVIGDNNGIVRILPVDYNTSSRITTLSGHTSGIEQIVFANTSKFMATACDDKTVRLWNMENLREQPIVLSGHSDWVRTAVFSADDEQLLAGMHSNAEKSKETIHAWPTRIETISGLLCQYLNRNLTDEEWEIYVDKQLTKEVTCPDVDKKAKK
jgi:WD40 repeat protein